MSYNAFPPGINRPSERDRQAVRATKTRLLAITMIAIVTIFGGLAAVGVFTPVEAISITQTNFNFSCSTSQVLFSLTNNGYSDVTIAQVVAAQNGVPGQIVSNQLTSNTLPAGSSASTIAFFPGLIFVGGAAYNFTLMTTRGGIFLTSSTVPSVTVVEQMVVTQAIFVRNNVTFTLRNIGTCPISIASTTVRGSGINGNPAGTIISGSYVPAGNSTEMLVSFPGVTFQSGYRYTFTLTSARGTRWLPQFNAP